MRLALYIFLLSAIMFSCNTSTTTPEGDTDRASFQAILAEYYQERLQHYPMEATMAGDNRYNDTLTLDISEGHRAALRSFYNKYLDRLASVRRATLDESDQMSFDILKWECNINLEGLTFPTHLTPIDQFWSLQLTIGQWASGLSAQPFKTPEDYDHWLSRLEDFSVWCDTAMVNMNKGMKQGYVLPKMLALKVIPQLAVLSHGPAESHLYYGPINQLPNDFTAEEKEELTAKYVTMINETIIPTFQTLHDFFKEEYLPNCRESTGITDIPNGKAYYDYQIKHFTTTSMTAEEVFDLGKKEVARLLSEMESVKAEVGFEGDLKAFFEHVRSNKKLMPYDNAQAVIDDFNGIHQRMKPALSGLFELVPKTAFEVRRTEAFREASASAEYQPGSLDGTRPGIFYVPIPDVKNYNRYSDESLFLHEAIPGHHYQISLQQENTDLPEFRRALWYSAYGEGWALYSESLGKELALYEDPYQYFGMLGAEMHRAVRLVVDAGMHSRQWTREQAIQYSLENEAESEASIISEIERYMAMPAQALSYKVGQLKIRALRKKATDQLGARFDIKQFHNIILSSGCVPLNILEDKIDQWIALSDTQ
ncbi:DUF885 domain-containing protein [Fulvivirga sp. M361]|uniref:DUF885 domain-containing protein n=1 Tax=Fulvivirga sp. M361 TaxID=2594266 RepID=UPI00117AF638|nr:DUF885 domain-containing protein [Fulvivirga sp. M361]TRX49326.1 DUF885 domain-containing protein [Fulvivirga sp. M361]